MNFYDMMRRLAEKTSVSEGELRDFMALIEFLDKMNAFGTVAREGITAHTHDYQWDNFVRVRKCTVCSVPSIDQSIPAQFDVTRMYERRRY